MLKDGNYHSDSTKKTKLQPRRNTMNGIRLVGDAASLVDPFSGEGVGNALAEN